MHKFDSYIDSILKELKLSKKQRMELRDEFKDHLENLKQDFTNNGMNEEDAECKAIKKFGDSNVLGGRLQAAMFHYRTRSNIKFGVLYIIFALLFYFVGLNIAIAAQAQDTSLAEIIEYLIFAAVIDSIVMSVFAYFIPIVFKKATTLKHVILINYPIVISIVALVYACFYLAMKNQGIPATMGAVQIKMSAIELMVVPVCSAFIGFKVLNKVHGRTADRKELA